MDSKNLNSYVGVVNQPPPKWSSVKKWLLHINYAPGYAPEPEQKPVCRQFSRCEGCPYAKWKEMVGKQIDSAENAYQVFFLLNKPYYLTFLKFTAPVLSQEDLGQLLAHAWILEECPNQDRNVSKRELLALFRSVPPELLMDEEERAIYHSLDDPVTVYRGVTSYNAKNIKALSWTLDRDTAEWFAHRFGEEGTVYEAQISKEHILAFFNGRNESEVVVDPKYLEQIMESPNPEMEMQMT